MGVSLFPTQKIINKHKVSKRKDSGGASVLHRLVSRTAVGGTISGCSR